MERDILWKKYLMENIRLCDYGCGQEAKYQFKNGKWCCSKSHRSCPEIIKKRSETNKGKKRTIETKEKLRKVRKGKTWEEIFGKEKSKILKKNQSNKRKGKNKGKKYEEIYGKEKARRIKKKQSKRLKDKTYEEIYGKEKTKLLKENLMKKMKGKSPWNRGTNITIEQIKERYPFFSQIEEMRYNLSNKKIQVHCKNNKCKNSKEKGGWFTPTYVQFYERIRQLEKEDGNGGSYFYCSQECKDECILYNLKSDPYKEKNEIYTQEEINIWKQTISEQDNYECQKCGSKEKLHCHHIQPVKTHPHLSLDPTNGIVLCKKCHYEIGHKTGTECSTGNLANINQSECSLGNIY